MRKILTVITMLAIVAMTAAPTRADTVNAAWSFWGGSGTWTPVTIYALGTSGNGLHSTMTGMSQFTQTPSNNNTYLNNTFYAFCVDLRQYVDTGSHPFEVVQPQNVPQPAYPAPADQPMGVARADLLRHFFNAYYNTMLSGSNTMKQAFQLAVWEIVYEDVGTAYSLTSGHGDVYVTSGAGAAVTLANTWLAAASWYTSSGSYYLAGLQDLRVGAPGTYGQDFVTPVFSPVPLPGAALLGMLGLGTVGWIKRRFV